MKRKILESKISELTRINGKPYSYFISWSYTDNIHSNDHGKYEELADVLDRMEEAPSCIEGELPFTELVIYFSAHTLVFMADDNWDCVNDPSADSHKLFSFPNMGDDGNWLYIDGKYGKRPETRDDGDCKVFVLTDNWLDMERHSEFVNVYSDRCDAFEAALTLTNNSYGGFHQYNVEEKSIKKH